MHQATDGKMCHYQAIELLSYQIRGLTAQHYVGATQMSFEFVQRSLNFPSFMIQSGQFSGWRCFVIKNRRDQAIDGLCILNSLQSVFNNSNNNTMFFVTLILLRRIYSAQVRAIRESLFTGQTDACLNSPEQIRIRTNRQFPQFKSVEIPIRKAQHPLAQASQHFLGKGDLPGFIAPHAGTEQDVCPILDQGYEPQFRKGTVTTTGRWSSESLFVTLFVGGIKRASIHTDQTPTLIPSTFRRFNGDRLHNFVVQLPNGFPSQPCTSL